MIISEEDASTVLLTVIKQKFDKSALDGLEGFKETYKLTDAAFTTIMEKAMGLNSKSVVGTPEEVALAPEMDYFDLFTVPRLMYVSSFVDR